MVLCSYSGLRGAVGLSLALIVANSEAEDAHLSPYVRDIILLHVAGVAFLTLLINATTTGHVVRFLGLSGTSSIRKHLLVGVTGQLEGNIDANIRHLQGSRHFD